jgi:hypothetical protein
MGANGDQRALAAADIADGWLIVTPLPMLIANKLTGASRHKTRVARTLHTSERNAVWDGGMGTLPVWRKDANARISELRTNRVLSALGLPVSVIED